jgi:hypothetical protein
MGTVGDGLGRPMLQAGADIQNWMKPCSPVLNSLRSGSVWTRGILMKSSDSVDPFCYFHSTTLIFESALYYAAQKKKREIG